MNKFTTIARKITYTLIIFIIAILVYAKFNENEPISVIHGNYSMHPLNFPLNKTDDIVSKMLIREYRNSAEAVDIDGDTYFFAEPADMIIWLENQSHSKHFTFWVYTMDTKRWIDATVAWYNTTDNTVMGYGFGAREHKKKSYITFNQMRRRVKTGQTMLNPKVRHKLLEEKYYK